MKWERKIAFIRGVVIRQHILVTMRLSLIQDVVFLEIDGIIFLPSYNQKHLPAHFPITVINRRFCETIKKTEITTYAFVFLRMVVGCWTDDAWLDFCRLPDC